MGIRKVWQYTTPHSFHVELPLGLKVVGEWEAGLAVHITQSSCRLSTEAPNQNSVQPAGCQEEVSYLSDSQSAGKTLKLLTSHSFISNFKP